MMKKIELGAGVLLFIPTTKGEQLAFQFGQSGGVELLASKPDRAAKPSARRGLERGPKNGGKVAACVQGGGFDSWLQQAAVRDPLAPPVPSRALYRSYVEHAKANAIPVCCELSLTKFGTLLTAKGFLKVRGKDRRVQRQGLRLVRGMEADGFDAYGEPSPAYTCTRAKARRRASSRAAD
ncbi:hypothetical protein [Novosphingobium sp.]|uniref:hypothetical protein n=1 Tax=Novosphingobium sp. TaxID=1874826 RepID=UPI001D4476D6|nr:hypothetical protein [Novosphingobium sp.]MBX9662583.1 hypothetical protein [Novosphingobium sp.]